MHIDHADQVPLLHVRLCVPQLPHAWLVGPEQVHTAEVHVEPAGHDFPQAPQLDASEVVSTHEVPHRVPVHFATHPVGESEVLEQIGVLPAQLVVQDPQWFASLSGVSQPSFARPLQSPQPAAHADGANAHCPSLQLTAPATCGKEVQSFEQEPHV
jgi:hypothetical protein